MCGAPVITSRGLRIHTGKNQSVESEHGAKPVKLPKMSKFNVGNDTGRGAAVMPSQYTSPCPLPQCRDGRSAAWPKIVISVVAGALPRQILSGKLSRMAVGISLESDFCIAIHI